MKTEKYTLVVDANMCLVGVVYYIYMYILENLLFARKKGLHPIHNRLKTEGDGTRRRLKISFWEKKSI